GWREGGGRGGEVGSRGIEGVQRWKSGGQARGDQLEDFLRPQQSGQPALAEGAQLYPGRKRGSRLLPSRGGEEYLAAVTGRHEPRDTVQRTSKIGSVAQLSDPRVYRHPHPDRLGISILRCGVRGSGVCRRTRERKILEGKLGLDGGDEGVAGGGEGDTESVADGLEDVAVVA